MERLRLFVQRYLLADAAPLSAHERWRSALAAFFGMLLIEAILAVVSDDHTPRPLLALLGASSVILFALPHRACRADEPRSGVIRRMQRNVLRFSAPQAALAPVRVDV